MSEAPLLAFDVGGTRIKAGLVDRQSGEVSSFRTAPADSGFEPALAAISELGRDLTAASAVDGVGLCIPGIIDSRGIVVSLPGKLEGVEGFDLPAFLAEQFAVPSVVVNDAVAYAVGEASFGEGAGMTRVVVMTIGTGIGVTVVEDGQPLGAGAFGAGILGGHIPISEKEEGYLDTNGRPGTIEALCRAQRIVDYASDAGGKFTTVEDVYEAAERQEEGALEGLRTYRGHLTRALVALTHAHSPEAVIVGGGPATPNNPLLNDIEELVNERLFGSMRVKIRTARLGDTGAIVGLSRMLPAGEDAGHGVRR
jgi:glucokinase